MAQTATISRVTFAGGELSPLAAARDDLGRYQISIDKGENMVVRGEGGLTRRPGTRFVLALYEEAQKSRHIPFRFSPDDYYTIIVNGGRARLIKLGGFVQNPDTSPFDFAVPWTEEMLPTLRTAKSGNVITVTSSIRPKTITRTGQLSWVVADYAPDNGPVSDQNLDVAITIQASAATGNATLTGVGGPFKASHVGGVFRLDDRDLSLTVGWTASEAAIAQGQIRRWNGNLYEAALSGKDAGPNAPVHDEGTISAGKDKQSWTFLSADHGYVRVTAVTDNNHAAGTVLKPLPYTVVSGGTFRWSAPAWNDDDGWPDVVSYISPRLAFFRGDDFWLTSLDGDNDFDVGQQDDDRAIVETLKSPDSSLVNIRWVLPSGVIMLGTVDLEWSLRGVNVFDPLTPKNVRAIPETSDGSAAMDAVKVDNGAIYVGKTGKRLHFANYQREEQKITSVDLSRFARHIFRESCTGMAWQRDPHRILWLIFDDGSLASMTYVPDEQILAFMRHPMQNAFVEQICCVPSTVSGNDEVTMTVRRTIAGRTRRYVEQLADFFEPADVDHPTAEGAWFVDCGLRLTSVEPVTQITQLIHLAGEEVAVFADGAMQRRKTVSATGVVSLDRPSRDVLVGKPIDWYVRDLPRNLQVPGGSTRGKKKNAHEALVQFHEAGGGEIRVYNPEYGRPGIDDPDNWERLIETGDLDYDTAPKLETAVFEPSIEGATSPEVQLELRGRDAMPATLLALSPRVEVEES